MIKIIGLLALCLIACSNQAQNLVPNPSFELIDSCPQYPNTMHYQDGARPLHWYSFFDTPDYYNACENNSYSDVPLNSFAYQQAADGNAYSGALSFLSPFTDSREFIGVQLTEPLQVGETYHASMYINPGCCNWQSEGGVAIDHFGMLFTMDSFYLSVGSPFTLRNYAQVFQPTVVTDTAGWTLVSGAFVADSAYQWLVIGNHFSDVLTDTVAIRYGNPRWAYVFVDGVSVTSDHAGLGSASPDPPFFIGPNPAGDQLELCPLDRITHVWITDATGRICASETLPLGQNVISLHGLAAAIYQLHLDTGEVVRFVKQ